MHMLKLGMAKKSTPVDIRHRHGADTLMDIHG